MIIDSTMHLGASLPAFTQEQVKNEPMLFSCSAAAARELGGPITRAFLDALDPTWAGGIIDTRVHMLMRGWYPCIPGWHHDDVPRTRSDGQPNYETPEYFAKHAMALVGAPVSKTRFALGRCALELPDLGTTVYGQWHREVSHLVACGELKIESCPMGQIVYFDWASWHRGVPASGDGWRWFGRITRDTHRKITNELRKQVQLYMSAKNAGW